MANAVKLIEASYMWFGECEKWTSFIDDAEKRVKVTNDRGVAEMYMYVLVPKYVENRDNAMREYIKYVNLLNGNQVPMWNPNAQ